MIKVLNYTKNPLSLMGECASSCWNSNPSPQIGIDCIESGHGRVLEFADVVVEIDGYSARCVREIN
jgi:thymidylate synthase (FAD)